MYALVAELRPRQMFVRQGAASRLQELANFICMYYKSNLSFKLTDTRDFSHAHSYTIPCPRSIFSMGTSNFNVISDFRDGHYSRLSKTSDYLPKADRVTRDQL